MKDSLIQVSRIYRFDGESKLKAFADVALAGIVVKGFSVVNGSKGLFVSMPRHLGKDGKWYSTVYPTTKELKEQLSSVILSAYKE
ncbi:MAG: SpoVG family protein [Candidatus Omnitrophota bacterium]|nr:SpoVG family protein [Candidatus Omnitrophota bacterium]MBU1929324.1 SpoVG family protein [Candidatus Omnitrophota bacterium]MBU2035616.1 SpoVG family protein [Candidatus Omnitrophota bacterium]MBU2221690.1 SpoVG family protein [Candidatus Omnitrophota bacterium]